MIDWKKPSAYRDAIGENSSFALAVSSRFAARVLACEGRIAPRQWLWDGGRLLPALVFAAAKRVGCIEEALNLMVIPRGGEITYLPRACVGIPNGLDTVAASIVANLPAYPPNPNLSDFTPIVDDFMREVILPGGARDDRWSYSRYINDGIGRLCLAHDWRLEVESILRNEGA